MVELSQGEFGLAARGAQVTPGVPLEVDLFIGGISSSAHAAVRDVHRNNATVARSTFVGKMAQFFYGGGGAAATARGYLACLDQYIAWDRQSAPAVDMPTKGTEIIFAPGDVVRARPDVVLDVGSGNREARVLLWDDLPLNTQAGERIALPFVEYIEGKFGPGSAALVSVWHLAHGRQEGVLPGAAQARRADVQALLASL